MTELWLSVSYMGIAIVSAMTVRSCLRMCLKAFEEEKQREKQMSDVSRLELIESRLERVESVARAINLSGRLKR